MKEVQKDLGEVLSTQALDVYCILAQTLKDQSMKSSFAYLPAKQSGEKEEDSEKRAYDLNYRAFWRSVQQRSLVDCRALPSMQLKHILTILVFFCSSELDNEIRCK